eukprot:4338643-Pleurochrysis_carterae.AAC.1
MLFTARSRRAPPSFASGLLFLLLLPLPLPSSFSSPLFPPPLPAASSPSRLLLLNLSSSPSQPFLMGC